MDETVKNVITWNAKKEEQLIKSVLPDGMSIYEAAERCEWVRRVSDPIGQWTLYMDQKPLLTLFPPRSRMINKGESIKMELKREYKIHNRKSE